MQSLEHLFHPKSIAIIGASESKSINAYPLQFLLKRNFSGKIFPVNPKYPTVHGLKCYSEITDINEEIDIAIVLVNAKRSLAIIKQCVEANVRFAVMLSAGFGEIGEEGQKLEHEIKRIIENSETRVLGPNSIGFLNLESNIPLGFAYPFSLQEYLSGSVAICSQSGAYGLGLWTRLQEERVGVKYLATTGNELDVAVSDFIKYFSTKPDINVIGVYVEGFSAKEDADAFFKALEKARANGKRVVILKAGRSEVGEKASQSHTASLTGGYDIFSIKCAQYGANLVTNFTDQINVIKVLNTKKQFTGRNIGIVTTSGALGIITADACLDNDLSVPQLTESDQGKLEEVLPDFSSVMNPIDVTAQIMNEPKMITEVLNILDESDLFNYIILLSSTISGNVAKNFSKAAIEFHKHSNKPILVCLTGGEMISGDLRTMLQKEGVSFFKSPEQAVETIAHISNMSNGEIYVSAANRDESIIKVNSSDFKTEKDAKQWLSNNGFQTPKSLFVTSLSEIELIGHQVSLAYPVIIKGQVDYVNHKTEYGLVKSNINNSKKLEDELTKMWTNMVNTFETERIKGILIEEQIADAIEVIIGAKWDPLFGPVLVFGSGGIYVELLKDINLSKVPLCKNEALQLIKQSKIYPILNGYRNGIKYDVTSLANFIIQFSKLISDIEGNISEIEINPLFVLPGGQGVKIVDALIV